MAVQLACLPVYRVYHPFGTVLFTSTNRPTKKRSVKRSFVEYLPFPARIAARIELNLYTLAILSQLRLLDANRLYQKLGVISKEVDIALGKAIIELCRRS